MANPEHLEILKQGVEHFGLRCIQGKPWPDNDDRIVIRDSREGIEHQRAFIVLTRHIVPRVRVNRRLRQAKRRRFSFSKTR